MCAWFLCYLAQHLCAQFHLSLACCVATLWLYRVSMASMTPACKEKIEALLHNAVLQPLSTWLQIQEILLNEKLAWKATLVPASFLVHPCNRSGCFLSPIEVHSKGAHLLNIGLGEFQLGRSTCFELSQKLEIKAKQLAFNNDSSGYLAPCSGTERYLTVSSSHATALQERVGLLDVTHGSIYMHDFHGRHGFLCQYSYTPFLLGVKSKMFLCGSFLQELSCWEFLASAFLFGVKSKRILLLAVSRKSLIGS